MLIIYWNFECPNQQLVNVSKRQFAQNAFPAEIFFNKAFFVPFPIQLLLGLRLRLKDFEVEFGV